MKTIDELMKEYTLNDKQALVVKSDFKELIVPAGAGSGKTKTLVTKVLELLKQGKSLDNFLVLTFTKKAASEMKERIKASLISAGMFEMANKIDSSNISTFDAFAYNFVKQNANLIGLSSDIELLDQAIFNNIKEDIINKIILDIMINQKEQSVDYEFVKSFSSKTDEKNLIKSLLNTYTNLIELGSLDTLDANKLSIRNDLFNYDDFILRISEHSEEFSEVNDNYVDAVKAYFEYVNGYNDDYPEYTPKRFNWKDLGLLPSTKSALEKVIKPVTELLKVSPTKESLDEYFSLETKTIETIIKILIRFEQELNSFKESTNKYEFSDIANFLNKILRENLNLLERQKNKFIYVFVDEYQDTSKVQSEFLEMLIENNEKIRVLYVGDIKQSIYKFRNAKPDTFLAKQKEVELISLDTNYRSSNKVISFVNDIFTNILTDEEKHDINYVNGHIMESGNSSFAKDKDADVFLLEMFKDEKSRVRNDSVEEAFVIGNKIKELLKEGKIKQYKDVAILARNKGSFKTFRDVFKYLNIPIQIQVAQDLKQTYLLKLISNILNLAKELYNNDLKVLNNKRFYYMSIVRSELFNRDDYLIFNDLLDLDEPTYRTLKIDDTVFSKLKIVNKVIKSKSNFEIIDTIIDTFDIYEKISKTKKYQEKLYQIEYLYNTAQTLSDLSINSNDFLDYITNLAYNDDIMINIDILEDANEDSVKITNIHQSKGLEYNTLFVSSLNKEFNKGSVINFNFTSAALFNVNLNNATTSEEVLAFNDYIKEARTSVSLNDNLKEELRLLYVALTRAEKALYLVTVPKDDYIELSSFTDYLYLNEFNRFIKKENITTYNSYLKDVNYYKYIKESNSFYSNKIKDLNDNMFNSNKVEKEAFKASSSIKELVDLKTYNNIKAGNDLHLDFEYNNTNNSLVRRLHDVSFNGKILNDATVINEYQFSYDSGDYVINGIIDLLAIYDDEIHIIDYKLRDLNNSNYLKQLNTYYDYIKLIYDKPIKMYLYSITTNEIKEVKVGEIKG